MLADLADMFPVLAMDQLTLRVTNSLQPSLDPMLVTEHIEPSGAYASVADAIAVGVAKSNLASAVGAEYRGLLQTGRPAGTEYRVLLPAVFTHVYLRYGGETATEGLPVAEGLPPQLDRLMRSLTAPAGCPAESAYSLLNQLSRNLLLGSMFHMSARSTPALVMTTRPLVHMASVLLSLPRGQDFMQSLLLEPRALATQYLPTMGENELGDILRAMGNVDVGIYHCPNGHPYLVGNCTRTLQAGTCPCGAPIGNTRGKSYHNKAAGNTFMGFSKAGAHRNRATKSHQVARFRNDDGTQTTLQQESAKNFGKDGFAADGFDDSSQPIGYGLGSVDTVRESSEAVRQLTPISMRMLRFLMHGLLELCVAMGNKESVAHMAPSLRSSPDYFNEHALNDWSVLKTLLRCSDEDLSLTVHLVIARFARVAPLWPRSASLARPRDRDAYEQRFQREIVAPVMEHLQPLLTKCKTSGEAAGSYNAALSLQLAERDGTASYLARHVDTPLLLRFRCPVTFELFRHAFCEVDPTLAERYPIIDEFLRREPELHVLRHVYDVIRWQVRIHDTYVLRVFPLCALVPRVQGSSGAVSTVQFVWRGHAKTPTTRAGPWPDFALRLE